MNPNLQRGLLLFQQSRHELAEKELRQALADDPQDAWAHALLGLCLAAREQFEEATAQAQQAIHLAPDFPYAHYAHAHILHDRRRYPEAMSAIQEAIRLDPTDPDCHAVEAMIHLAEKRWSEALTAAEQGLEADPEHIDCTNFRAIALLKLGRRAEAGATIDVALAKNPDHAVTHANQGWTCLENGEPAKALDHFREALRLDPDNEWARMGIVEALKARNVVYAWMLQYFLWMSRLSSRAQWGIILGGYFLNRMLGSVARSFPAAAPWVTPVRLVYLVLVILTWTAYPMFNLLLRLNRFGRLALNAEQVVESNWFGASALLALASFGGCWVAGFDSPWWISFGVFGLLLMPLSGLFRCSPGWPRKTMTVVVTLLAAAGFLAIGMAWIAYPIHGSQTGARAADHDVAFALFGIGIFGSTILANLLAAQEPTR